MLSILGFILIVIVVLGFPFVAVLGMGRAKAKKLITAAIKDAREGDYHAARAKILLAATYDGRLKKNADISALYEVIVSDGNKPQPDDVTKLAASYENKNHSAPEETWWQHPLLKVVFFTIVGLSILVKVIQMLK